MNSYHLTDIASIGRLTGTHLPGKLAFVLSSPDHRIYYHKLCLADVEQSTGLNSRATDEQNRRSPLTITSFHLDFEPIHLANSCFDQYLHILSAAADGDESASDSSVIHVVDLSGEWRDFFSLPFACSWMVPLGEGLYLFLAEKLRPASVDTSVDVLILDRTPAFAEGEGETCKSLNALLLYDARDARTHWLTDDFDIEEITFDANSGRGVMIGREHQTVRPITGTCVSFKIQEPTAARMTRVGSPDRFAELTDSFVFDQIDMPSPFQFTDARPVGTHRLVLTGSDMKEQGLNQFEDIFLRTISKDDQFQLTPEDWDISMWNSVRSDVSWGSLETRQVFGNDYYFCATVSGKTSIYRIKAEMNRSQPTKVIELDDATIDGFKITNDGIWFVTQTVDHAQELCFRAHLTENHADISEITTPSTPTQFNQTVRRGERVDLDNSKIKGTVWIPDYKSNDCRRLPTVLMVHGGPRMSYGESFLYDRVALLQSGFAVLATNPPGSDGLGRDYADLRGKYGESDLRYLLDFLDLALRSCPQIDPERLGVWGGSYGGYMSAILCGSTTRFAAACIERPIVNWQTFFTLSDIGWYFSRDQLLADLWKTPDLYWSKSPLSLVGRWRTPALLIQGSEDFRCPEAESRQLLSALHLHGVPAVLRLYRGANHQLSVNGRPDQRIDRINAVTRWFSTWLC